VHAVEDAGAALAYLRSAAAKERFNIDPQRIIVVGHSVGGYVALRATAKDAGVRAVAALSPLNGTTAEFKEWPARRAASRDTNVEGGPVVVASMAEAIAQAPGYDFLQELAPLRDRPVLLIAATRDAALPMARHHDPIAQALRDAGAKQLEIAIFEDDHVYSAHRITLLRRVVAWVGQHVAPETEGIRQPNP
jgi:dipeptidyl aminopeptidase/acylaminoacyl peptidase